MIATDFGTWNVRTLKGKELELIGELKRYRLDVAVDCKKDYKA